MSRAQARRLLLPCFYAVQMAICFFPRQGPADISGSDHTGVRAPLFGLNLVFFVFYAVVLVAALCLGFVRDRRMDSLRQRHLAAVETELIHENIKMHFDGNIVAMNLFSDVGKLRRNFERWKRTALASNRGPETPVAFQKKRIADGKKGLVRPRRRAERPAAGIRGRGALPRRQLPRRCDLRRGALRLLRQVGAHVPANTSPFA